MARLSVGLAARGHDVTACGPADASVRAELEAGGVRYVALPWVGSVPAPRQDGAVLAGLLRLLGRGRGELVHAHAQKAGLLARPAAALRGVPALYSPHSFVYRTQLLRPRRGARIRHAGNAAVERALGRITTRLAAVAHDEADAAVADGLVPRERVRIVEYGVALEEAAPDPALAAFRGDGPLLGLVAGLRDQKGLPTLLDALELLARQGRPVRFAIVGNGPMHGEVARRLAADGLRETTLLRPFEGAVEPYLAALDAFVLPSYWEGMPIAVLEAMAAGLPVVASAVNGTPEAVDDGRTGTLVPPHDARALADALAAMAADAEVRARMGAAGRAEAGRRFTIPRMVAELEAVYREVAAR